jgi:hypothetical protein
MVLVSQKSYEQIIPLKKINAKRGQCGKEKCGKCGKCG